jgi:molybdopterin molybdotransferase
MLTVEEATRLVKEFFLLPHPGTKEIYADRNYPPFHRVMMDGVAVKFDSFQNGQRVFKLEGICPAGSPAKTLSSESMEVMTGAPLPHGADLVIPYEHLKISSNTVEVVEEHTRSRWDNVHLEGSDCKKGDLVLGSHLEWNGPHVGIAASMGEDLNKSSVKIMVISTGDELVDKDPLPHEIRRSNAFALKKSLELFGYENITLHHLPDDPVSVASHYQEVATEFDFLIYSGGVSKGKYDYLPEVWEQMKVKKIFHQVAQRPGKPLWFGVDEKRKTMVVGLPGNPVSSLVCLHRYFLSHRDIQVKLEENITFKKNLTYFCPVRLEFKKGEIWARPLKVKNSGEFTALAGSDGFIELPANKDEFSPGELYSFYSWRPL